MFEIGDLGIVLLSAAFVPLFLYFWTRPSARRIATGDEEKPPIHPHLLGDFCNGFPGLSRKDQSRLLKALSNNRRIEAIEIVHQGSGVTRSEAKELLAVLDHK